MGIDRTQAAGEAADRFAAAHRALRENGAIQFDLPAAPPPPGPPAWLTALGHWLDQLFRPVARLLEWIGSFLPAAPYARIFLWSVLALAAAGLVWMVIERVRHGEWRLPRRRRAIAAATAAEEEAGWAPDEAPVRAWLAEADRLAAGGRYAEAAHHLLFRSVEDIRRRRPDVVRPSRTSRELAREVAVPERARALFGRIAALVERSLFGGRAVSAAEWDEARRAYADFALPVAWRRA